jgi:dienelactone hydrolase
MITRIFSAVILVFGLGITTWGQTTSPSRDADGRDLFREDRSRPLEIADKASEPHGGGAVHDISFSGVDGKRIEAYLVVPGGSGPFPGILYAHWLGAASTTNRTEFLLEAEALLESGVASLLVTMPWTEHWYQNRNLHDDYDFSIRQVQNLRRALDVLVSTKGIDKGRLAFVGHDFGASFGAILLGVDSRVRCAVLMAGTPILSDWFLFFGQATGAEKESLAKQTAPLDPVNYLGKVDFVPILFQFSDHDQFIPKDKAELFANAAKSPKKVLWYDAGHELNSQAADDRSQWLRSQLKAHP